MSTIKTYPRLVYAMDELRRAWRQRHLLEAALLIIAAVLGVLVLAVAADNLLAPGVGGRVVALLVLLASGVLLTLGLFVKRFLEDERRDDFFAALCENEFPELNSRLINAMQLGRGTEPGSPQIVDAIVSDANEASIDLDLTDSLDWQPVRRAALAGLGVLLVLAMYAGFGSERFGNGLSRILMPFAEIEPFTATQIIEKTIKPADGSNRYAEGMSVKFVVGIEGVLPANAELRMRPDGDDHWTTLVMNPSKKGVR